MADEQRAVNSGGVVWNFARTFWIFAVASPGPLIVIEFIGENTHRNTFIQ